MEQSPRTLEDPVIYDLEPEEDASWDMILDAVYRDGSATFEFENILYVITVEDLRKLAPSDTIGV